MSNSTEPRHAKRLGISCMCTALLLLYAESVTHVPRVGLVRLDLDGIPIFVENPVIL